MASVSSAGSIFSIVFMIVFSIFWGVITYLFWSYKDQQPIKGRQPILVLFTDVVLLIYVIQLCFQRIFEDKYPCALNLWTGFLGTIILFNFYLWRCWVLYSRFQLTQAKLNEQATSGATQLVYKRKYEHPRFLIGVFVLVTLVLLLPCIAFHAANPAINHQFGDAPQDGVPADGCELSWSRYVLVVYVVLYVLAFSLGAFYMRVVVDGFKIKEELRATGVIGILCVIPWAIFNTSLNKINHDTFPFSTLALLLAIAAAFVLSTVWPLYRALYKPPAPKFEEDSLADFGSLAAQLAVKVGYDDFAKFLTTEFSIENLLFFTAVERYREQVANWAKDNNWAAVKAEAEAIKTKYIGDAASHQVNLPSGVVKDLEAGMLTDLSGLTADSATSVKISQRYSQVGKAPTSPSNSSDGPASPASNGSATGAAAARADAKSPEAIAMTDIKLTESGAAAPAAGADGKTNGDVPQLKPSATEQKRNTVSGAAGGAASQPPPFGHKKSFIQMRAIDTLTVFDNAQKSIFGLMESDAYSRYRRSDQYAEFVKSQSKNSRDAQVLKQMDLA